MADIARKTAQVNGLATWAPTDLTGADILTSDSKRDSYLYIMNTTGGSSTVVIDGDGVTDIYAPPAGVVDGTSGYSVVTDAGDVTQVSIGSISGFLTGTVNVTGGATGVFAWTE